MATHSSILGWRIPMVRGAWRATVHGAAESDPTEQMAESLFLDLSFIQQAFIEHLVFVEHSSRYRGPTGEQDARP